MKPPITIYQFTDAPQELQNLSDNGGDEDWLAIVPKHLKKEWIPWMEEGSTFGCCCVNKYKHPTLKGYEIRIGCHS
jgi:hypothetical protein